MTRILARDVAEYVAAEHALPYASLTGHCRRRHYARPRQIAMYAVRRLCPHMSYPAIGRMLGGRDHTTIMHGDRQIAALRKIDAEIDMAVCRVVRHFAPNSSLADSQYTFPAHRISFEAMCASYGQAMRMAA